MIYDYSFNHLNLNKLSCEVYSFNSHVVSMHEKLGATIEGTFKEHVFRKGEYQDVIRMSILKKKYLELKKKGLYDL